MGNYVDLLKEFFVTDFKLRYKHSYLGFLWVILKPLSYYVVLHTIWTSLFGNTENYASYLLLGILTLGYFTEGVNFGLQSLFNKAHIILKVNFPREVVVLSAVAIATVNFLINLGIYFSFRIIAKEPLFTGEWYLFLLGFLLLTIFLLGIAFFTSIISIRYHDIKHLIELLLQLIFWATPVFYKLEQLPAYIANLIGNFNPLVPILSLLRSGLLPETLSPSPATISLLTAVVLLFTASGYYFFKKNLPKIAEYF